MLTQPLDDYGRAQERIAHQVCAATKQELALPGLPISLWIGFIDAETNQPDRPFSAPSLSAIIRIEGETPGSSITEDLRRTVRTVNAITDILHRTPSEYPWRVEEDRGWRNSDLSSPYKLGVYTRMANGAERSVAWLTGAAIQLARTVLTCGRNVQAELHEARPDALARHRLPRAHA